jgi:hypothetical protein
LGFSLKAGSETNMDNWRLLFVRSQMGLLQEGVWSNRLRPSIWQQLHPCQSGYQRAVDDAWLVLFELAAVLRAAGRSLYIIMGDFEKAFPRTWRQDLLCVAARSFLSRTALCISLGVCWSLIASLFPMAAALL